MHNSAIFSLFLVGLREFLLLSMLSILLLLPFINLFDDNAFSSENKTLTYIFEPFLKLNGTDFYDIENNDQLQLEDFTLGTWFRTNQSSFDEPAHIVNKGGFNNERTGKNMNYGMWMNTDGTITAGFESDSGKNIEILSKKKYNDGKWHYVIVLYNSTVLRMDIDGHTIENLETSRTPDITGNQPLRLGANSLDLDKYFNGEVDELRIWNRGLAINELSEIYINRNFTTNGQVDYLNFGKNIMEDNKERIDDDNNNSITNTTKEELLTTLGTKQPPVIFVFVISKDILQELLTATEKQPPIIVEPKTPSKTNATKEELPITTTKKQQPPIVEPKTPSKTNATKEGLPTTTKKQQQQPPIIVEPQTQAPSKTNATKEGLPTTTKKQQHQQQEPPIIVEPKTSNQTTTAPTLLSNNISKNTADNVRDKINLAFENLSVNRSVTNSVEIKGDIKNNTPLDLQEIKVSAEYYDKTGTLLAKVEHFITSPSYILKPNEQVSFDILEVLGFGFHKLGDYNIVASGETIN
ncbi:MAG: LamG-like jellyroll fold domain-containing protein [Nitrososphaeraceae archaeon]